MAAIPYLVLLILDLFFILYLPFIGAAWLIIINILYLILVLRGILWIRAKTFRRDMRGLRAFLGIKTTLLGYRRRNATVATIFHDMVLKYGENKDAMMDIETGKRWTFRDVESFSNQVANYFQNHGYRKGDVVALYMTNCPEYACIWLGLSKLGVITALINYNLRSEPLGHCIGVANAKAVIVGGDLQDALADAMKNDHVSPNIPTFVHKLKGENGPLSKMANSKDLLRELESVSKLSPTIRRDEKPGFTDVLLYIYTSGTTGLPKAAIISNARYFLFAIGMRCTFRIKSEDRNYMTMPMYHSAAGIAGIGQCLLGGTTAVIRKKFSASRFWEECIEYDCTISQYIGELCRYLLIQPPKDTDHRHKIWMMFGNGLRVDLWEQFVSRFNIKEIREFYGSTEGNAGLVTVDNQPGACGFLPRSIFTQFLHPVALLKVDPETGELARDSRGLCIRCGPGECGEAIGKVRKGDAMYGFDGYVGGKDTNKKLIRNVYRKGDMAFSSGDILYMDKYGYLYFKDRTGDTFRWKGENVSTAEVEAAVQRAAGMSDATVYGVEVPGADGKAGMATIVDENQNMDLKEFYATLQEKLPSYARPIFLHMCKKVETTGTFKLIKHHLQKSGFNPAKCQPEDKLYYLNAKRGQYEELTPTVYSAIENREIAF